VTRLTCPKCKREPVRRSKRNGFTEQVLSLVYIYPFRCEQCDYRFWALQFGVRYVKVVRGQRDPDPG
jgi:hypothetical protein